MVDHVFPHVEGLADLRLNLHMQQKHTDEAHDRVLHVVDLDLFELKVGKQDYDQGHLQEGDDHRFEDVARRLLIWLLIDNTACGVPLSLVVVLHADPGQGVVVMTQLKDIFPILWNLCDFFLFLNCHVFILLLYEGTAALNQELLFIMELIFVQSLRMARLPNQDHYIVDEGKPETDKDP